MIDVKRKDLSQLQRRVERIEQEGYLLGCWIGQYQPGGTARGKNVYFQLRSKEPLAHGKKSKHLTADELPHYQRLIANGRELRKLKRDIAYLEKLTRAPRATLTASASDEWYTPPEFIEMARQVLGGIDLDPASNATAQRWIGAETWYGIENNGLGQQWRGRTWLNPPYGAQVGLWTDKAIQSFEQGHISQAVLLVRPAVASRWYMELAGRYIACTPHKRIRFIDKNGIAQRSPVHGNAFFYMGAQGERFRDVFGTVGVISKPL